MTWEQSLEAGERADRRAFELAHELSSLSEMVRYYGVGGRRGRRHAAPAIERCKARAQAIAERFDGEAFFQTVTDPRTGKPVLVNWASDAEWLGGQFDPALLPLLARTVDEAKAAIAALLDASSREVRRATASGRDAQSILEGVRQTRRARECHQHAPPRLRLVTTPLRPTGPPSGSTAPLERAQAERLSA